MKKRDKKKNIGYTKFAIFISGIFLFMWVLDEIMTALDLSMHTFTGQIVSIIIGGPVIAAWFLIFFLSTEGKKSCRRFFALWKRD